MKRLLADKKNIVNETNIKTQWSVYETKGANYH